MPKLPEGYSRMASNHCNSRQLLAIMIVSALNTDSPHGITIRTFLQTFAQASLPSYLDLYSVELAVHGENL